MMSLLVLQQGRLGCCAGGGLAAPLRAERRLRRARVRAVRVLYVLPTIRTLCHDTAMLCHDIFFGSLRRFSVRELLISIRQQLGAWPLAQTSTACSDLMDYLNAQRTQNLNLHERLSALETALRQHNKGKGLGFVVGGIVVDVRLLSQAFLGIFSVLSTVIPLIMLLRPADPEECALTDLQVRCCCGSHFDISLRLTINCVAFAQKAAFQSTAAAMNLTCTFNMSVGPGGLITDLAP